MVTFSHILLASVLFATLASPVQDKNKQPVVVEGKVLNEASGKPVAGLHVYVVDGEEEALTDTKGEFRITTWQSLPVRLTIIDYTNSRKTTRVVHDPGKKQLIRLK